MVRSWGACKLMLDAYKFIKYVRNGYGCCTLSEEPELKCMGVAYYLKSRSLNIKTTHTNDGI